MCELTTFVIFITMIKVKEKVHEILLADHEAVFALSRGILNLSSYARIIHPRIEKATKKQVKLSTIIMALSRIKPFLKDVKPMIKDVEIDNLTVKTPLCELVFEKNTKTIEKLSLLEKAVKPRGDEWFSFSQNTRAIIVICNESKGDQVIKHMKAKPLLYLKNLSAIGISLSDTYHPKPNITFSLIHRIAEKQIPLAETISTWSEIIFIFKSEYLSQILEVFKK